MGGTINFVYSAERLRNCTLNKCICNGRSHCTSYRQSDASLLLCSGHVPGPRLPGHLVASVPRQRGLAVVASAY